MSDGRLTNQIYQLRPDPLVRPIRIPVLLSDSKGLSLQNQVTVNPETFIDIWCYPGATAENGLDYLRRSLASHLQKLHPMTLFVWVGTFNLTTKYQNGRIELTGRDSNPSTHLRTFIILSEHLISQSIRVITKLPNSEQSYKGKVKTHNYINRQNQSTTGKL